MTESDYEKDTRELLKVHIAHVESSIDCLSESITNLDKKVTNELSHRYPQGLILIIGLLTSALGATVSFLIQTLR